MQLLLAQLGSAISVETVFSALSVGVTGYFWLVKSRQERPKLTFYQLMNFRASLRRSEEEGKKRWPAPQKLIHVL